MSLAGQYLPDLVRLVEDQLLTTKYPLLLTRPTVVKILEALPEQVAQRALDDPERWARIVAGAIRTVTIEEMVAHIGYEPLPESDWWDAEVVFIDTESFTPPVAKEGEDPSRGVARAPAGGANLYDHVIHDSHVERTFAGLLESDHDHVRLFAKLPRRFRVATPVGEYSPDWAFLYDRDGTQRLYLVRETKDTVNLDDLPWDEAMRIRFAQRHFAVAPAGPVSYGHTTGDSLRIEERSRFLAD